MIYVKFDSQQLGKFWIEIETGQFDQGLAWAQGCQFGSQLSNSPLTLVDTRLSKHSTERTLTKDQTQDLFVTLKESLNAKD